MTITHVDDGLDIPLHQRRGALGKEFHPYAHELFPPMNGTEFEELVDSIKTSGFYACEPITLHQGKIIDGRNRALACEVAKIDPIYTDLPSGVDPLQFVIAKNLHRRHLNETQRATVAARIATMKHGGDRKSNRDANLQVNRATAANMLNVSERSVANAAKVLAEGTPELVSAVERGDVAASTAAVVTELPKEEQRKAVAGGKKAVVKVAKQVKAKRARAKVEAKPAKPTGPVTNAEPTNKSSSATLDDFIEEWARSKCRQIFETASDAVQLKILEFMNSHMCANVH
jgi:ParB-like chromosome segregation protein Spo0J